MTDDEKLFGYNALYSFILVADTLNNAEKLQDDAYEAILEGLSNAVADTSHGIKHWSNVSTAGVAIKDEFLVSGDVELGSVSDDEIFIAQFYTIVWNLCQLFLRMDDFLDH